MTLEQLQQTVMLMDGQLRTQAAVIDEAKADIAKLREQSKAAHDQWLNESSGGSGGRRDKHPMRLMDQKASYPEVFRNERSKFRWWSRRVMAYCNGTYPGFRKVMKWCSEQEEQLEDETIDAIQWEYTDEANGKLYDMLLMITDGESQNIIENTKGEEQGFEAWRKLVRWFDPSNAMNEMDKVNLLLGVPRCKNIAKVAGTVEQWESNWAEYVDKYPSSILPESWRTNMLLKMIPEENEREIRLRYVGKGIQYPELRGHIFDWIQHNTAGKAPMQLDSAAQESDESESEESSEEDESVAALRQKGGGKKGAGRKGGGKKGTGKKGASKGGKKGEGKKGAGRKILGNCWKCKKPGHMSQDCTSSLEQDDAEAGSLHIEDADIQAFGLDDSSTDDDSDSGFQVVLDWNKKKIILFIVVIMYIVMQMVHKFHAKRSCPTRTTSVTLTSAVTRVAM